MLKIKKLVRLFLKRNAKNQHKKINTVLLILPLAITINHITLSNFVQFINLSKITNISNNQLSLESKDWKQKIDDGLNNITNKLKKQKEILQILEQDFTKYKTMYLNFLEELSRNRKIGDKYEELLGEFFELQNNYYELQSNNQILENKIRELNVNRQHDINILTNRIHEMNEEYITLKNKYDELRKKVESNV